MPGWTPVENTALLLALVQSIAPSGPSKHQIEAALKLFGETPKWTNSAVSQHYNKSLRNLSPRALLGDSAEAGTPAKARKAPAKKGTAKKATLSKAAIEAESNGDEVRDAVAADEVAQDAEELRPKKKAAAKKTPAARKSAVFPNLKASVDEAKAGKKRKREVEDEGEDEDAEGEMDGETPAAKIAKREESEGEGGEDTML